MSTLLVELRGPQQSWGSRSRFTKRATELAPTKSGVIGLFAAALGVKRDESLSRFDHLRFGVRIDQPGILESDFQTTHSRDQSTAFPISHRHYLADAVFLTAVESDSRKFLKELKNALAHPHYPLYLGRRAFPPSGPLKTQIVDDSLREALRKSEWRAHDHHQKTIHKKNVMLTVLSDAEDSESPGEMRQDVPRSFDQRRRLYDWRKVTISTVSIRHPNPPTDTNDPESSLLGARTEHDAEDLVSKDEV